MQKQLITFPDGTSRYVPARLRIGAAVDERATIDLSSRPYLPGVFMIETVDDKRYTERLESPEHLAERIAPLLEQAIEGLANA